MFPSSVVCVIIQRFSLYTNQSWAWQKFALYYGESKQTQLMTKLGYQPMLYYIYIALFWQPPLFEKMPTSQNKKNLQVSMNAWSRLWAACVSSGVPDITTVLCVVPG